MKHYIFLSIIVFLFSSCAVRKQKADIEYHHNNRQISGAKTVNENTVSVINNDGEIISSNLEDSDKLEIIQPVAGSVNENFVMPEQITTKQQDDYDNEQEELPQITQIKDETKKQLVPQAIEYLNPVDGKIITKFGEKTEYGSSKGISIGATKGTKIVASASGKVIYSDFDATFGNLVIIKLDNKNLVLSYAHLENLTLSKGAIIRQGDVIGYVGATGKVKEPQLGFAMREGRNAVDPLNYLNY